MTAGAPTYTDLVDLLMWEARRYGGNEPVFATELPTGRPLEAGRKLRETWRAVFGPGAEPPPGAWRQCPSCRTWYVHRHESDRSITDHEADQAARRLLGL